MSNIFQRKHPAIKNNRSESKKSRDGTPSEGNERLRRRRPSRDQALMDERTTVPAKPVVRRRVAATMAVVAPAPLSGEEFTPLNKQAKEFESTKPLEKKPKKEGVHRVRGSVTIWFSEGAIKAWAPQPTGKRGRQRKYSPLAIEMALTLRELFNFTFRCAEGFVTSALSMMGLKLSIPDHTTLSRRSKGLNPLLMERSKGGEHLHMVVDSTGVSIHSEVPSQLKSDRNDFKGWKKLRLQVNESGPILPR
jgi:hypothetical protein